jgi:hypothetical protein
MVADMDVPGFKLHPLKGREKGFGRLRFVQTGGSFFALPIMMPSTLITWTTTEKGD